MSAEEIRSIGRGPLVAVICGVCGCLAGAWIKAKMSRWVPKRVGVKGRARLLREHRGTIQVAHALSVAIIVVVVFCYKAGLINDHDWRGMGVAFGLMALLPLSYMVAVNARHGREAIKEVFITMSIAEKTPVQLYFGLMAAFLVAGILSVASLLLKH